MAVVDWNPDQYRKFAAERAQPFHDLVGLVQPADFRRAVDLGCGPGELTAAAAATLRTREMVGIDNSPAMITAAAAHARDRVADELAHTPRYLDAFDGEPSPDPVAENVLAPEQYSQLLFDLGSSRSTSACRSTRTCCPAVALWCSGCGARRSLDFRSGCQRRRSMS